MSGNPREGLSGCCIPTDTSPYSRNEKVGSRTPIPSLQPPEASPPSDPAGDVQSRLALPVSPVDQAGTTELAEDSRADEERKSRTAEFELRAKKMGITGDESIAEKVAIWEGMWVAEQTGNDIQVGTPFSITARYRLISAN
ncbi:hypothetical protein HOY80DRAFT_998594 [Tuber brumale]|nr:hypothetical protein HOY80DRAFT_998594 [Tuber brumale]